MYYEYSYEQDYPPSLNQDPQRSAYRELDRYGYDVIEIESPLSLYAAQPEYRATAAYSEAPVYGAAVAYAAPLPYAPPSVGGYYDPVQQRMMIILAAVIFLAVLFAMFRLSGLTAVALSPVPSGQTQTDGEVIAAAVPAAAAINAPAGGGAISPLFAPSVRYWEQKIVAWSAAAGVDPNMAATVMQIESCGDPQAISSAGARGLFQVMPFHFTPDEDMLDPDTNARRGLNYLAERLVQTNGDTGRAFAGYNGGHRAAGSDWNSWANETQRYYVWSTGIYSEVQQELAESPTLQRWLQAGGASLCRQAASRLGLPQ